MLWGKRDLSFFLDFFCLPLVYMCIPPFSLQLSIITETARPVATTLRTSSKSGSTAGYASTTRPSKWSTSTRWWSRRPSAQPTSCTTAASTCSETRPSPLCVQDSCFVERQLSLTFFSCKRSFEWIFFLFFFIFFSLFFYFYPPHNYRLEC